MTQANNSNVTNLVRLQPRVQVLAAASTSQQFAAFQRRIARAVTERNRLPLTQQDLYPQQMPSLPRSGLPGPLPPETYSSGIYGEGAYGQ